MKNKLAMMFFGGMFLGTLLYNLLLTIIPTSTIYKYDKAIELCEKDLPRSQSCVITAIPKKYT